MTRPAGCQLYGVWLKGTGFDGYGDDPGWESSLPHARGAWTQVVVPHAEEDS